MTSSIFVINSCFPGMKKFYPGIFVSNLHIHPNGTKNQGSYERLPSPWIKVDGKKNYILDFLHPCMENKPLKLELKHQVYRFPYIKPLLNVFVLKQVIEDCKS